MFGIIIGAHGNLAEELLKSCEMICGTQKNLRTVTLMPGESLDDVLVKYKDAIAQLDCTNGLLFLNDLFGGSPFNAACRLAAGDLSYGIVTGVNLPMLIEMVSIQNVDRELDIHALMKQAAAAASQGVHLFHASLLNEEDDDL